MGVTLVTGAGGGMGRACVERFGGERLLLVDSDEQALQGVRVLAPAAEWVVGDVGEPASIDALVRRTEAAGGLDRLLHLAGVSPTMVDAARIIEIDLVGTAALLDALAGTAGPGSVAICMGSIAAHVMPLSAAVQAVLDDPLAPDLVARLEDALGARLDSGTAYALAKHGVLRLCQRAAAGWGARGARVLSISPGLIDTPMGQLELKDNPNKQGLIGVTPIHAPDDGGSGELPGRPADIADAIEFLAGPRARFVSGCDLRVDGGLVAALN